jgi:hypothetical protein
MTNTTLKSNQKVKKFAVKLIASSSNVKETEGEIQIQVWSSQERLKRALKAWGMCWAGALISVLIPLAHFILVPSLFLAGPIAAYFIYQQQETIQGGEGKCPACKKGFKIVRTTLKWPIQDLCTFCQEAVSIIPKPGKHTS